VTARPPHTAGLRIALVSDWYLPRRGGIELHLHDLAAQLGRAGHAADVITTLPADAGPAPAVAACHAPAVRLPVPRLPGAGIAFGPRLGGALLDALRAGRYDVVHCHASVFSPATWAGAWAARRLGLPCVVTFHSVLHVTQVALAASDRLARWSRWPLVMSGVSALVAAQLRRAVPAAHVVVLPNGVDVAWWRTARDGDGDAWPSPPEPAPNGGERGPRVVTAMRLSPKKCPLVLVDVAERLVATAAARGTPPPRLVVAGDGPSRAALERRARRRGVDDVMELLGWQPRERLRALYADADCFVLPTAHEAFGIAALEARAAGVPVVARRGTGVEDFVHDGRDGLLAATEADVAAAVARLVSDDELRGCVAAHSRAVAPVPFDWRAVIARHEAAYRAAGA
jgi:glycosyltransferase involved in cell wall biosynthesis